MIIIRKANKKDLKDIKKIFMKGIIDETKIQFPKRKKEEVFKKSRKDNIYGLKEFGKNLSSQKEYWIVAEENKKILGFSQGVLCKSNVGELRRVYISKEFRGKDIGTKLCKEIVKWLKSKKVEEIKSLVYYKNKPSIKMQEKLGFEIVGVGMHLHFK